MPEYNISVIKESPASVIAPLAIRDDSLCSDSCSSISTNLANGNMEEEGLYMQNRHATEMEDKKLKECFIRESNLSNSNNKNKLTSSVVLSSGPLINQPCSEYTQLPLRPKAKSDNEWPCPTDIHVLAWKKRRHQAALERVMAIIFQFSRRSTIHGLNHMAQAPSARRRFFWLLICLCASCGFFINLFFLLQKYLQIPVLTTVLHDHDSFEFPDITLCNINPIYFPPKKSPNYTALVNEIDKYFYLRENIRNDNERVYFQNIPISDYLFVKRKISLYGIPNWVFIRTCNYLTSGCSYKDWISVRRWPYGQCYTFNLKTHSRRILDIDSATTSMRPDLRLTLYKATDYPKKYQQMEVHATVEMPSGILVIIHEPGTYPNIGDSYLLDRYAQIDIRMAKKMHLSKLNRCSIERGNYTYVDIETNETETYFETRPDCVNAYLADKSKESCGCILHRYPYEKKHENTSFCTEWNFFRTKFNKTCWEKYRNAEKNSAKIIKSKCYKDWCEHNHYTIVVSQANFPSVIERNSHFQWLKQLYDLEEAEKKQFNSSDLASKALLLNQWNTNGSQPKTKMTCKLAYFEKRFDLLNIPFIERNFMYLRIVPGSLYSDQTEESEEYPLSRMLGDVGGCVGLWVGASLITLFEFLDLILDFLGLESFRKPRSTSNGTIFKNNLNCVAGNHATQNLMTETPHDNHANNILIEDSASFDEPLQIISYC